MTVRGLGTWVVSVTSFPEGQTRPPAPQLLLDRMWICPLTLLVACQGSQVLQDIPAPHIRPIQPLGRTQPLLHHA